MFRKRSEFNTKEKLPKSLVGRYVRKVYQGKLEATRTLSNFEIEDLIILISKIL